MSLTDNDKRNYLVSAALSAIIIWIVKSWWPDVIPLSTFAVWTSKGDILDWLALGVPLFIWGFVVQTILEFVKMAQRNPFERFLRVDRPEVSRVEEP